MSNPVIVTLILVSIAVVGGSIIFVFSQGFFSSAQIAPDADPDTIIEPEINFNWSGNCDNMTWDGDQKVRCVQLETIIQNQERIIELLEKP